ncbi:MAG: dihydrolipoyl dehydrogenase [Eubacterium sp.]|jgi:dihydrolipoamide dehydrogenase
MNEYDLVIIGGGPGGYETAGEAFGRYGMKTCLIEERDLGGTCLNRGCIPTKTLLHTSELLYAAKTQGARIGLTGYDGLGYDMAALKARKDEVIVELRNGIAKSLKKPGIDILKGHAEIVDNNTIRVKTAEGASEIKADKILIATGASPFVPPIKGADLPGVVTSEELLDNSEKLGSIVIVGGGVIGLEFACMYNELGTRVTIVEALDRLLAPLGKTISQSVKMQMKKIGVDVHLYSKVTEITGKGGSGTDGLTVKFEEKGAEHSVTGDIVLMAVGRHPNVDGLIAPDASDEIKNLSMKRGFIKVDEKYMTSARGVYAIGDVIGGIQLAHMATAEGRSALAYMNGVTPSIDMKNVPSVVYMSPEIAVVGLTEEEAREAGFDAASAKYPMGANGKTVLSLEDRSFMNIVFDKNGGKVLGAQLMCARASDMISQIASSMRRGETVADIASTIFPHPSFSEAIGETARLGIQKENK